MLNTIKRASSGLGSQVKVAINWRRDNWQTIQTQTEKIGRWAYGNALNHIRQGLLHFNRGERLKQKA